MGGARFGEQTLQHCLGAVDSARLEVDPFPHFIATDLLPTDVYAELLSSFPAHQQYEVFSYNKHRDDSGAANRFRFRFTMKSMRRLPQPQRQLWLEVCAVLASPELKQAVFRKLSPGLELRYGVDASKVSELSGHAMPELFRETQGYTIKPHPDTRRKVVTMQLALPGDESQRELGTELYRMSLNPLTWLRAPHGFEIVRQMPFLPNMAYAFTVLNTFRLRSWHGRSAIPAVAGTRNSILNLWYDDAADIDREILEPANLRALLKHQTRAAA
ncbi:MAG: hypothetical protein R3B90_09570 [Planctomycetaceae bacterium]